MGGGMGSSLEVVPQDMRHDLTHFAASKGALSVRDRVGGWRDGLTTVGRGAWWAAKVSPG